MADILNAKIKDNDAELRPAKFEDYIGQERLKNNLKVYIGGAKFRNESLDHVLFYGPPGLGKTTLAYLIANELDTKVVYVSGPSIEKPGDLAGILSDIEPNDVLFIDEIHRLPRVVEEVLYSAMEDFKICVILSRENSSKSITLNIPPFTLIGATTKPGSLSSPLRSRFGIVEKLSYYSPNELAKIVSRTAKIFKFKIDSQSALEIGRRSRGTPRIANRILKRVRDFANYNNFNKVGYEDTLKALKQIGVDELGLDEVDIKYLYTLVKRFNGGPVGIETIASSIGEEIENIEQVYEPYLLKIGMIDKTIKGRIARPKAFEHIKGYKNFSFS